MQARIDALDLCEAATGGDVMDKIKEIQERLDGLEGPLYAARNLAMAVRMMASADEMPKEAGAALDTVADLIFMELVEIMEERKRILELARRA